MKRFLPAPLASAFAVIAALIATPDRACGAQITTDEARAVENLAVFARLYGYVRFFHPSDAAAAVDWDRVALLGAEATRDADTTDKLRAALQEVFGPIAPTMRLDPAPRESTEPPPGGRVIYWQYSGIRLGENSGPYRQRRVITGEKRGEHAPLFDAPPPPLLRTMLAPGIALELPLALPVDAAGRTLSPRAADFAALQARLAALNPKASAAEDWRVRVAGVAITWALFQHFHPYLGQSGVSWEETLRPALRRALPAQSLEGFRRTLSALVAQTWDGHGWVYGPPSPLCILPIRVAHIENQIVVTGVGEGAPFHRGDLIERIDGVPAIDLLRDGMRHAPGSPHLSEHRALNAFGETSSESLARVAISRDGVSQELEVARRRTTQRPYFFQLIPEFEFPAFAEVRPGIFYVNLRSLEQPEFAAKLPQLARARGVIFDQRYDGRKAITREVKSLHEADHIIPHLIDERIQTSPMLTPQITRPDRAGWTYRENGWPVQPKAPRIKAKVVFINDPAVVSYGETCMAMIAHFRLATLVGAPTAGCNGNANILTLPGAFNVMWTGLDVLKHDRSPFYGTGFVPEVPVTRTLAAVKTGRDEYLEKAIAVIEQGAPGPKN